MSCTAKYPMLSDRINKKLQYWMTPFMVVILCITTISHTCQVDGKCPLIIKGLVFFIGTAVVQIQAHYPDGSSSGINYSIFSGNKLQSFSISPHTGMIVNLSLCINIFVIVVFILGKMFHY